MLVKKTLAFVYFLNLHSRLDMSAPKQPKSLLCNVKYIESIQKVVDLFPTNWSIEKKCTDEDFICLGF